VAEYRRALAEALRRNMTATNGAAASGKVLP